MAYATIQHNGGFDTDLILTVSANSGFEQAVLYNDTTSSIVLYEAHDPDVVFFGIFDPRDPLASPGAFTQADANPLDNHLRDSNGQFVIPSKTAWVLVYGNATTNDAHARFNTESRTTHRTPANTGQRIYMCNVATT